ncbi:phosphoribosylaminoimidazolesuccinocarboxamide synthase NDAI_0A06450 [Naumovozyma dairenensis CBS 421]|uniref:Phosphoribosylaminoimidazole-succinocarboxamide synthase n=1 Tax=Naumovozyma dairenensis (strain ATCC 10597 / BCRC 20456 / CBS 421 / NBRC 0211 / NRRL Y-12639) TaxID=1071378 RepID=G0W4R1_NAUDC|nr:hypothetical protein NDAI_0A06450 [Naumovozyma dairenensis CBS 421]CCD22799.1 hypothetical protein NDAI_0A06450 [Naumovozyma dairenensis CBS 421]
MTTNNSCITQTNLDGVLPLINRGKVRDIYQVNNETLLFVATDRISAYDVIMNNPIPEKGILLTKLSEFWFHFLSADVKNHLIAIGDEIFNHLPFVLYDDLKYRNQLKNRSMLIKKCKLIPLEVIVRGFLTGSAWNEYKKFGTVHGTTMPQGLKESQEFDKPIFTPSTKAEQGKHDENITKEEAIQILNGDVKLIDDLEKLAIKLYSKCKEYSKTKGIIIADTKFEFGIDEITKELILVDEVLTPDSSRFWSLENYQVGKSQDSFDKQFLRDWLTTNKLNGAEDVDIPEDIIEKTRAKYEEAYESLTY